MSSTSNRRTFLRSSAALLLAAGCNKGESTNPPPSPSAGAITADGPPLEDNPTLDADARNETDAETDDAGKDAPDSGWGHFQGRFLYDGDPPPRQKVKITADKEYCGQFHLLDESLVVGKEDHGLQYVILFLYLRRGEQGPEPHPSYRAVAEAKVALHNYQTRWRPHVFLMQTTQTLVVDNQDPIPDNIKLDLRYNAPINQNLAPKGGSAEFQFTAAERLPAWINCALHDWESAWLVLKDSPYYAVSDAAGRFRIDNLPPGEWTFVVWHEKPGYLKHVSIAGREIEWQRGRVTVKIEPGKTTDLGNILVHPEALRRA